MRPINLQQWILSLPRVEPYHSNTQAVDTHSVDSAWAAVSASTSCCEALAYHLGDKVVSVNSTAYSQSIGSYWSLRNVEIHPGCVVLPSSAEDVSTAVKTLSLGSRVWNDQCQFAIRGGGHTPFPGAATVEDGIVIDLKNLPASGLSADRKTITVSPSQKWDEVYEILDTHNLSTLGGRVAGVGVGGLITGCGISYFSPRYGFACDVVKEFEVVLGTGEILTASSTQHADLWKALRGGSNNFGIVTKFTLGTFPQASFWGGQTFHTIDTRSDHFAAHEDLIAAYPFDPYVHFINTLLITNMTASWVLGNSLQYTKSSPSPVAYPHVLKPFTSLPQTPLFPGLPPNTLRIDNVTSFSREYAAQSAYKKRWTFATISFGNSATMMEIFFQITNATIQPLINLPGFQLSLSYQPLPTALTSRHRAIDALGPVQTEGNMFMIHWAMAVDDEAKAHDDEIQECVKAVFGKAEKAAEELGLKRDFLALTYADAWQDVMGRRSAGTVRDMWKVSRKYDTLQVFQKLVKGGFKLPVESKAEM